MRGAEGGTGRASPSAAAMHYSLLLAGLGTVVLGPILPLLARQWQMTDAQSGMLFWVKFLGAFAGGVMVSRRLRGSLLAGLALGAVGFGEFAVATSAMWGGVGLMVSGFGLGLIIVSVNVIAGRRYSERRGAAIALLNFSWSAGAMLAPLLAAWLTGRFGLQELLLWYAAAFVVGAVWVAAEGGGLLETDATESEPEHGLARGVLLYFVAFLILYGGLETCIAGWLTTFAARYAARSVEAGQYATLLLMAALTAGRALTTAMLLRWREAAVQRVALVCVVVFAAALAMAGSAGMVAVWSVALGLSLAPVFPTVFSQLMARGPAAREAGVVVAVSGLGAGGAALGDGSAVDAEWVAASGDGAADCRGGGIAGDESAPGVIGWGFGVGFSRKTGGRAGV